MDFIFYFRIGFLRRHAVHEPAPAQAFQALRFRVGVAPSDGFVAVISQITLQGAFPDVFIGNRPAFFTRRKIPAFAVVAAPAHAITFIIVYVIVVRRYVKKTHIVFREFGR